MKEHCYEGETSRTLCTRSVNHFDDYKSASKNNVTQDMSVDKKSSWMWDHIRDVHNGDPNPQNPQLDFKFAVVSSHRDSMERQIKEAVRIKAALSGKVRESDVSKFPREVNCLNRKGEYFALIERFDPEKIS